MADALITHPPQNLTVVRNLVQPMGVRVADDPADNSLGTLSGYFSVFDTWYRIESFWEGEFMERTAPGAFAETIRDDRGGMKILFDHGFDPSIGNKVLAPIRDLREDKATGPYFEGPLFDTSYNRDLLPGLREGVYGSSFRFRVTGEKWDEEPKPSDSNPKGLPERTITKVRVFEFGPVTFPANPDATAGVRSATDEFMDRLASLDSAAFAEAVRSVRAVRPDFTGDPATRSGGRGERVERSSTTSTTEPPAEPVNGQAAINDLALRQRHLLLREKGIIHE